MKEILPEPPAIVRNDVATIQSLFKRNVVPSYGRFDLTLSHGSGTSVWDVTGKRYLDLGGGIAVLALGHAHPAITEALVEQSKRLVHISNLYYHEPQGRLAESIVNRTGPGKVFFCNSGAEANEGLFKLARKFGHDEGRFEILTARNSFHGRTLAGISATGQEKVKKGFEPMVAGFRHIPYNDLEAARQALSPATAAILIEGIQGEGGIEPATPEYLLGLRRLCDEKKLLLLMDEVQSGLYRTGRFQSFQRILENVPGGEAFLPDGISMAKSLGGGFPIGAFWAREPHGDLLSAGTHGTTFGGTPLGCAVALKILNVIDQQHLGENARHMGVFLKEGLEKIKAEVPEVIESVTGVGLMVGFQLRQDIKSVARAEAPSPALHMVNLLHQAGVMTIPSGQYRMRLLPPLNLTREEASEGLEKIRAVAAQMNA
jgi:acetylornithine/N-succinyldiaminopimelate aminotransferase